MPMSMPRYTWHESAVRISVAIRRASAMPMALLPIAVGPSRTTNGGLCGWTDLTFTCTRGGEKSLRPTENLQQLIGRHAERDPTAMRTRRRHAFGDPIADELRHLGAMQRPA